MRVGSVQPASPEIGRPTATPWSPIWPAMPLKSSGVGSGGFPLRAEQPPRTRIALTRIAGPRPARRQDAPALRATSRPAVGGDSLERLQCPRVGERVARGGKIRRRSLEDPLDGHLELLAGERPRDRRDGDDLIG